MKKYFRYSTAILLGGLFLGLSGCGSSSGSSCSSGEVETVSGCGTSCTVAGTNQAGGMVNGVCAQLSGATGNYSCAMYPGSTLQAMPAPYNSYPQFAASGGEGCCMTYGTSQECYAPESSTGVTCPAGYISNGVTCVIG